MQNIGFKDLEKVRFKATYNLELGGRTYLPGETVLYFDRIQIANFSEVKENITAHGGYGDRDLVFWDKTKEIKFNFSQGIFSKTDFALLSNSKLLQRQTSKFSFRENLESNENNQVTCKYIPQQPIFVYDESTGNKLNFTQESKLITVESSFQNLIVDYTIDYSGGKLVSIGQRAIKGFLEFEGITRLKDDNTGAITTGILHIPKLKLTSDLSIRLGSNASPVTANFSATALPAESHEDSYIMGFYLLDSDIYSDI